MWFLKDTIVFMKNRAERPALEPSLQMKVAATMRFCMRLLSHQVQLTENAAAYHPPDTLLT